MIKGFSKAKVYMDEAERMKKGKRSNIHCPNCGKKVKYGSEHARGRTEVDMYWICKKKG